MATDYGDKLRRQMYDAYLREMESRAARGYYGSEGQSAPQPLSFDEWSAQGVEQQFSREFGDNRFGEFSLDENDPLVKQFIEQYGARSFTDENGNPIEQPDSNNTLATGYRIGYGDPSYGDASGAGIVQDIGRVMRLPDGRYIREAGNLNSAEVAGQHRADETRSRKSRQRALMGAAGVVGTGLLLNNFGGSMFGGAEAGGLSSGASSGGLLDIPGNLSWTDIAAANPELAAAPSLSGAAAGAAGFVPPSTPLMLAPGSEAAAMMDSWLINNGMPWAAGGSLTGGLGMLAGDTITGAGLLGAGRAGLTAAGLLGTALGGGGSGSGGGGGGWSAGNGAGGGLNIQDANYVPNQHTARQLQELYGGNNMGTPSSGQMGGQAAPWQNNLYGGGQQGMPMTGGQQSYPSMATRPMNMMGGGLLQGMGGQNFGTKPMMMNGAGDFGPLPPPSSPPGDFGPLPPPASPGQPPNMLGPQMQSFIQNMRNNRPQVADQYVDPSVRNSAIGDGYSGRRNGFLWGGGQRLMPITGSDMQDQATLRQFGIRPPTFGSQYGF